MRTGSRPHSFKPSTRRRFMAADARQVGGAPGDLRGLFAAMRRYLEHLGVRGYTEQGRYNAERYIRDFIAWADERGVTHPQQVSRPVLERYQRWLYHFRKRDGELLAVASQRSKITPLRGFFKWLTRTGEIPPNPAADIDLPRKIKRLPATVLTSEEVERVMVSADLGTPLGLRDRAMMEVLYATGMRRMELARLEVTDVDLERLVVLIRQGKGQKDRLLPLGERAGHWVGEYLEQARPQLAWNQDDATLFLGNEGNPLHPMWLSTLIANRVMAAVGKRGGCHLWRHTTATLMLEGGADIRHIQAMLGHADISSMQIYTQAAIRQLAQVHAATHPGVRLHQRGGKGQGTMQGAAPASDPPEHYGGARNAVAGLLEALAIEAEDDPD